MTWEEFQAVIRRFRGGDLEIVGGGKLERGPLLTITIRGQGHNETASFFCRWMVRRDHRTGNWVKTHSLPSGTPAFQCGTPFYHISIDGDGRIRIAGEHGRRGKGIYLVLYPAKHSDLLDRTIIQRV